MGDISKDINSKFVSNKVKGINQYKIHLKLVK